MNIDDRRGLYGSKADHAQQGKSTIVGATSVQPLTKIPAAQDAHPTNKFQISDADLIANPTWHIFSPTLNQSYATRNAVEAYLAATNYEALVEVPVESAAVAPQLSRFASFSPASRWCDAEVVQDEPGSSASAGKASSRARDLDGLLQPHVSHVVWLPLRVPGYIGSGGYNTARYFAVNLLKVVHEHSSGSAEIHKDGTKTSSDLERGAEKMETCSRDAFIAELLSGKFPSMLLGKDFWGPRKNGADGPRGKLPSKQQGKSRERSVRRDEAKIAASTLRGDTGTATVPQGLPSVSTKNNEKGKSLPVLLLGQEEKMKTLCVVDNTTDEKDDEVSLSCIEIDGPSGPHILPGVGGTYRWKPRPPDYEVGEEIVMDVDSTSGDSGEQNGDHSADENMEGREDGGDNTSDDDHSEDGSEGENTTDVHVLETVSRRRPLPPFALLLVGDLHPFSTVNTRNTKSWDVLYTFEATTSDKNSVVGSGTNKKSTTEPAVAVADLAKKLAAVGLHDQGSCTEKNCAQKSTPALLQLHVTTKKPPPLPENATSRQLVFDSLERGICLLGFNCRKERPPRKKHALCATMSILLPKWAEEERASSVEEVIGDKVKLFWFFDVCFGKWRNVPWGDICELWLKKAVVVDESKMQLASSNCAPFDTGRGRTRTAEAEAVPPPDDANKPKKAFKVPGKWAKYLDGL
ncbi:unnamed protein product [Amoebophrya sp. A120]|nr:unnamed protein product [Amoebophrya sp. A120]|eukprot:GSA120T00013707001.1